MNIQDFLQQGFIFSISEDQLLLASSLRPFQEGDANYFYFPDFFEKDVWKMSWDEELILNKEQCFNLLKQHASSCPVFDWISCDLSYFQTSFDELQACINEGHLEKGVPLSYEESIKLIQPEERNYLLQQLMSSAKHLHIYGVWGLGEDIYGLSPELLFERNKNKIKTLALAGTRDLFSKEFSTKEFVEDQKEQKEHQLVVKSICEDLKQYGPLNKSDTYVWKLQKLAHLRTDIELTINEKINSQDLVHQLHPTPALGVFPKSNTEWLQQLEQKKQRGRFGAPLFVKHSNFEKAIVCIRNIIQKEDKTYIWAGCGVVKESVLINEWNELKSKRDSVKLMFGLV